MQHCANILGEVLDFHGPADMKLSNYFREHGLILALHYEARFLNRPGAVDRANRGFENILARYARPAARQ